MCLTYSLKLLIVLLLNAMDNHTAMVGLTNVLSFSKFSHAMTDVMNVMLRGIH